MLIFPVTAWFFTIHEIIKTCFKFKTFNNLSHATCTRKQFHNLDRVVESIENIGCFIIAFRVFTETIVNRIIPSRCRKINFCKNLFWSFANFFSRIIHFWIVNVHVWYNYDKRIHNATIVVRISSSTDVQSGRSRRTFMYTFDIDNVETDRWWKKGWSLREWIGVVYSEGGKRITRKNNKNKIY